VTFLEQQPEYELPVNLYEQHSEGIDRISVEDVGVHDADRKFVSDTDKRSIGGAVSLLKYMNNMSGNVWMGLRSITYRVDWYNVGAGESISWQASSNTEAHQPSRCVVPGRMML